jgi:hypothetical protein
MAARGIENLRLSSGKLGNRPETESHRDAKGRQEYMKQDQSTSPVALVFSSGLNTAAAR